jgi:hypothetical protein
VGGGRAEEERQSEDVRRGKSGLLSQYHDHE